MAYNEFAYTKDDKIQKEILRQIYKKCLFDVFVEINGELR